MPPRPILSVLLLLATLPPFVAQASGSVIGSYAMLNRIERYHLELSVAGPSGERRLSLRTLAPHLSADARVIVLPAEGEAVGAGQIDLVAASLPDLARLACALDPATTRARATLTRDPFDRARERRQAAEVTCSARR